MSENVIKVGSIVFSPDYGKGKVSEIEEGRAWVDFMAGEGENAVSLAELSTTNPADDAATLRAENAKLAARVRELEDKQAEWETALSGLGQALFFFRLNESTVFETARRLVEEHKAMEAALTKVEAMTTPTNESISYGGGGGFLNIRAVAADALKALKGTTP